MKEIIFGIKMKAKKNKRFILFFVGLAIIGFLAGSIFITILSKSDKVLVKNYMEEYMALIRSNKINYFTSFTNASINNFIFLFSIWILGMSIIGIPIILFIYFIKSFTLGFSITAILLKYRLKGCIIAFIYMLPSLFSFIWYTILVIFSIKFSLKLSQAIIKRKSLDFKILFSNYLTILIITILFVFISICLETFAVPYGLHKILLLVK